MTRKTFAVSALALAIAYLAGRYSAPAKVTVTKEIDTTKDQIISELNRQLAFKSSDAIHVTTTIRRPDGTEITRVRIENKLITVNSTVEAKHETDHETRAEKTTTVTEYSRGVVAGPLVTFATTDLAHPLYGGFINAPILGPIHGLGTMQVGPAVGVAFSIGGGWEFK